MIKDNIFVDFDDTIVLSTPTLISYINQTWGINSKESDYLNFNKIHEIVQKYRNDPSISYEEVYLHYRSNFSNSEYWHSFIKPMDGVCEIFPLLADRYNIFIITKRSAISSILVNKLINKYVPRCIHDIYYAIEYKKTTERMIPKTDFILKTKGNNIAFIDDSLNEIEESKDIIPSFLFDPKNKFGQVDGIQSVRSWYEIKDMFL